MSVARLQDILEDDVNDLSIGGPLFFNRIVNERNGLHLNHITETKSIATLTENNVLSFF